MDTATPPTRDALYGLLSNQHVRATIGYLGSQLDGADPDEWGDITIDREGVVDHFSTTFGMPRRQAYAALHHSVLPRLADMDVIDYDHTDGTIRAQSPRVLDRALTIQAVTTDVFGRPDPLTPAN